MRDKLRPVQANHRVEQPLKANGRARPPAHAFAAWALEMAGEHRHPVRQPQQPGNAVVLRRRVPAAEIRSAHVAHQERIAGQNHRRLRAALRVYDQQGDQFRPVPRRVDDAQPKLADLQLLPIAQRLEGIGDMRGFVEAQRRSVACRQIARAGDVVGVDVVSITTSSRRFRWRISSS